MPIRKFSDQSFESPNLEDWIGEWYDYHGGNDIIHLQRLSELIPQTINFMEADGWPHSVIQILNNIMDEINELNKITGFNT